jgi:hypothetical protein
MDEVTEYLRQDVFVTNTALANIPTDGSHLRQGSYVEGEENVVKVTFTTEMKLPNTTAIMITLPPVMSSAQTDQDNLCKSASVKLNSVERKGFECHWQGKQATFTKPFAGAGFEVGIGSEIEVGFLVDNPSDNADITKTAYKINVYDAGENLD